MGIPVLILGESGSGKSASLRNFKKGDVGVMNVAGKPLPFKTDIVPYNVSKKAKEKNILLEVNNSSLSPNSFRPGAYENYKEMLGLCKKYGVRIILGSDSHICYQVGIFDNAEKLIDELDFPRELVINYHEDEIIEFFGL